MATAMFTTVRDIRRPRHFRFHEGYINNYSEEEVRERFRFGKTSINYITSVFGEDLNRETNRNHALSAEIQLLIALRFYASGSFLQVLGDTFGVNKSTVSRAIYDVSRAISKKQGDFIKWPSTTNEVRSVREGFYDMYKFPGVVGCIDGTHIRILAPHENEPSYVNRKNYHSINVQAICDHEGRFTNIVARWPGSTHDSHIIKASLIGQHIEYNHRCMGDGLLLGDSGYALRPFLMTPYAKPIGRSQERFNSSHKRTRCLIERTFGRWKRRFHVLHSEIRMVPERVCTIIGACAVLHNIAIMLGEVDLPGPEDEQQPSVTPFTGPLNDGKAVRDYIARTYF